VLEVPGGEAATGGRPCWDRQRFLLEPVSEFFGEPAQVMIFATTIGFLLEPVF